ncbi:AraC family transcriptional regulator [Tenacibaculum sp. 190524A05c]|uniref:Tetratricopeptide repeat-containing protein n=1 Tax=Tenacibaculum platacis TaxID=3137852 RepID=A0ABP1EW35_9FLAO
MKAFFSLLFLYIPLLTFAQSSNISSDSIPLTQKEITFIETTQSSKEIRKFLKSKLKNDTLSYIYGYKLFLKRAITENNLKYQYSAASQLGYFYYQLFDHSESITYTKQSLKASRALNDTLKIINSTIIQAGNYYQLDLTTEALKNYIEAKTLSEKIHNENYELTALPNIANIRVNLNKHHDALNDYSETLEILEQKPIKSSIPYQKIYFSSLIGKGICLKKLGKLDEAIAICEKGIALAKELNLTKPLIDFRICIADVYYYKKQFQKAINKLTEEKESINLNYPNYNIIHLNYYLARCYNSLSKNKEALLLLEQNFKLSEVENNTKLFNEMFDLQIKIAKEEKNLLAENTFRKKKLNYIETKAKKHQETLDLIHKSDINNLLGINQKLSKLNEENSFKKKTAYTLAFLLVVALILSFIYFKRKNKIKSERFEKIIAGLKKESETNDNSQKESSQINDEQAIHILSELSKLEKTEFFKSKDCNLYTTSKAINTNTTYLSKTLNKVKKQSFSQYLNELRINYVLLKLQEDSRFRSYTIKAISEEIGYKSVTTFLRAFKAKTNLNPSYYIEKLNNS